MRIAAVLNRDGGTLKSADMDAYCAFLHETFRANGHEIECDITAGSQIVRQVEKAFESGTHEAVLAGGGDGTISCAAAIAWRHKKPLGVIPAGTMNMFARALKIPIDIHEAAQVLSEGQPEVCDIASANGQPFVYQFSVGLHPHIIRSRKRYDYKSRLGKMRASLRAIMDGMRRPPVFPVQISWDEKEIELEVSSVAVSNNRYGDGHLPHPDKLDSGELGIYFAAPVSAGNGVRMLADVAFGTWRNNPDISEASAKRVTLTFPRLRRDAKAVIDGELIDLEERVELAIHARQLNVIAPPPPEAGR